jgi:DNA-directed RNA polymerase specialized sigma24 family protein
MIERRRTLEQHAREAASFAIQLCAQNLLSVDTVAAQTIDEWLAQAEAQEEPSLELLRRMSVRFCSRHLYQSCCSCEVQRRNRAFENLRSYLQRSLNRSTKYAQLLAAHAIAAEDVLQLTLAELHRRFTQRPPAGPDDPSAFLKWAQTILFHNAYHFIEQVKREEAISLEAQTEAYVQRTAVDRRPDHTEEFCTKELQQILENAILSLKNPRYRHVLIGFLVGKEEHELALSMGVRVQDIYLWRHRALKALRSNKEVVEAHRLWPR